MRLDNCLFPALVLIFCGWFVACQDPTTTEAPTTAPPTTEAPTTAPPPPPTPPPPPPPPAPAPFPKDVQTISQKTLSSTRAYTESDQQVYAATYLHSGTDVDVIVWPMEFCHGIHICAVASSEGAADVVDLGAGDCVGKPSVLYYPYARKLIVDGTEKAWDRNYVRFTKKGADYFVDAYDTYTPNLKDWLTNPVVSVQLDAEWTKDQKSMLVVTNSRNCHAHVAAPGRLLQANHVPFFNVSTNNQDENKFLSGSSAKIEREYPFPSGHRTFDTLPEVTAKLKKMSAPVRDDACMPIYYDVRTSAQASTEWREDRDNLVVWKYSVSSEKTCADTNTKLDQASISFQLTFDECQWVRLWISREGKQPAEFTDAELGNTFDFFFENSFFIAPHTDTARSFAMDPAQMGSIRIRILHEFDADDGYIAVSYGYVNFESMLFHEVTKLHQKGTFDKTNIYLMKSPFCKAGIVEDGTYDSIMTTVSKKQCLKFSGCEVFKQKFEY